ncbi:MAG: glycosyltransferase family 1 protein [Anaerolineae bacterium]|nr:glycosyltransferase family 1 protein [Anaerolineae bacterium]
MRIAIFTETFLPKWDGIAHTLTHYLKHIEKRGHSCLMFAPQGAPESYAGTPIIGLPSFPFPFYPDLKLVPPVFNVKKQLAEFKPDIVHLVNLASLGIVGMNHARELKVPVVASYHTDLPGYAKLYGMGLFTNPLWAYFRWLHNQADLNFCPSNYTKAQLETQKFERLKVWSRGVDTEHFNPQKRTAEWRIRLTGGEPDAFLLLYIGRLGTEKRVDWLRPLLDILPKARLAIVGDGPMREDLKKQFESTRTVFTGYLKGEDLSHAYAAADLFVFPSANETFGNVVLEAMASGLPVIAPCSGGPVDMVTQGENGYLFEPGDIADMCALTWRCVMNMEHTRQMSRAARAYAKTRSWEKILDGVLEEYTALIQTTQKNHGHIPQSQTKFKKQYSSSVTPSM